MQISGSKAFASPTGSEVELAILVAERIVKALGNSDDGSFLLIVDSSTLSHCAESHTGGRREDTGVYQCVLLFWSQGACPLLRWMLRDRLGQ